MSAAALFATASAHAATVVENIDQTDLVANIYVAGSQSTRLANAFTTGTGSQHYRLNSIQIKVKANFGSPAQLKVWLARASGANPGTNIKQLSGTSAPGVGKHTYTCSSTTGECDLSPNTTYFAMLESPDSTASQGYRLQAIASTSETGAGTGYGWSIADRLRTKDGTGNWQAYSTGTYPLPLKIDVTGLVTPVSSKTSVSITEGGTANYTVQLAAAPMTYNVTVSAAASGDGDVSVTPESMVFTSSNWNTVQTVTVSAAEDNDGTNGTATITHTARSIVPKYNGRTATVAVTEADNDLVLLSRMGVAVPEGGSAKYTVKLAKQPSSSVTVTVAAKSTPTPDSDLTASTANADNKLTFTTTNWNDAQTVTVSAASDGDALDGTATFGHTSSSSDSDFNNIAIASVVATEADSGKTPTLEVSGLTPNSATLGIVSHGGGWYYKRTSPTPASSCLSAGTDTEVGLTGLSPGSYTYKAYSDSSCGTELASATFTAPPAAPTGFAALLGGPKDCSGSSENSAVLEWDDPGDATITRYEWQRLLCTEGGTCYGWQNPVTISGSDASTTSAVLSCVSSTFLTDYRIRAVNATPTPAANGGWSEAGTVAGNSADYRSVSPRLLSAVAGVSSVALTWEWKNHDGSAPHTGLLSDASWAYYQDGVQSIICDDCPTRRTHTVTGLNSGQTYTFQIKSLVLFVNEGDEQAASSSALTVTLPGMTITPANRKLAVTEGSTGTYTVQLAGVPTNVATVSVAAKTSPTPDPSLTVTPTTLTFTPVNYNTAQTVTVTAAEDNDGVRGTTTFTHELIDGSVQGDKNADFIEVTETENDYGLTFSPTALSVPEGGNAAYGVTLAAEPTDNVTVTVSAKSSPTPDSNLTLDTDGNTAGNQDELTFTTSNWNIAQSVTVSAAEDGDSLNGSTTYAHTPDGGGYGSSHVADLVATEQDNDQSLSLTLSPARVWEDADATTVTVTAALTTAPSAAATVTLTRSGGTATSGTDYTALGTLPDITIAASTTSATATFVVTPTDDETSEGLETIVFTGTTAGVSAATGTLNLEDDETALSLSLSAASALEDAGATTVTVTATLDAALSAAATVALTAGGTATGGGTDYTLAPATLPSITVAAGATTGTATVTITPTDDSDSEAHETIVFTGATTGLDSGTATFTITDNENPTVDLSLSTTSLAENASPTSVTVTLTATLNRPAAAAANVNWERDSAGTATNPADYVPSPTSFEPIRIAAGQSSGTVTMRLTMKDDTLVEGSETIIFKSTATNLVAGANATFTILDDDGTITLSLDPSSAAENAGATTVTVTAALSSSRSSAMTVTLALDAANSTASSSDYVLAPATLPKVTVAADATSGTATVTIAPTDDSDPELDETVVLTGSISGLPAKTVIRDGSAGFTIEDEDDGVILSLSPSSALEDAGATTVTVTATLNATQSTATTVTLAVDATDSTASSSDYVLAPATLPKVTVAADATSGTATVTITPTDDSDSEVHETIVFAGSAASLISGKTAFTITDDENPTVNLSLSTASIAEDASPTSVTVTATATLNRPAAAALQVPLAADDASTATASTDYVTSPTSMPPVRIAANGTTGTASFVITVTNDALVEGDETIIFKDAATNLVTGTKATFTIVDDDGTIALSLDASSAAEGAGATTVTVTAALSPVRSSATTVTLALDTTNSTASSSDYALAPATLPKVTVLANATSGTATVTITPTNPAVPDPEPDETVKLTGSISGLPSNTVYSDGTATFTILDNDLVELSASSVSVSEGGSETYTAVLKRLPTSSVTVTVAKQSGGDGSLAADTDGNTTGNQNTLTFATGDWDTAQTVTILAAQDDDGGNGTATFEHTASSDDARYSGSNVEIGSVTATESDDDTQGLTLSLTSVTVPEGGTETWTVKLATEPTDSVTVTVVAVSTTSGDPDGDLTLSGGPTLKLTFATGTWDTAQTVTVSAAQDDDGDNGTAAFRHTASGGDYAGITDDVTATEQEDDTKGLTFSSTAVKVPEGGTKTYTAVLDTKPSDSVTVTVTAKSSPTPDGDLTVSTANADDKLTFTTTNWDTAQTVTVSAAQDDDGDNGAATFEHTAGGGGYGSVTGEVAATEQEDDTKGFTFSATSVTVPEGGTKTYTVVLDTQPTGSSVTVTVTAKSSPTPDDDLTVSTANADDKLTFTTGTWNTVQTVTVSAAQDADNLQGSTVFEHTASGGGYASVTGEVTATEDDDDKGLVFSPTALTAVPEGGRGSYTVKLTTLPTDSVTVTVAKLTTGTQDGDLALVGGPTLKLTFTTGTWNTVQTVSVSAAQDDDGENDSATFGHTASGGGYVNVTGNLTATEQDDDPKGFTFSPASVAVPEGGSKTYTVVLDTEPTGSVTVTVAAKSSPTPDADLTASTANAGDKLTFPKADWNTAQTVTVSAAQDLDGDNGAATFEHTASGGGYGSVTGDVAATEQDDDPKGFTLSPASVTVAEGGSATYTAKLATQPSGSVTVTVVRQSGDADLTLSGGPTLKLTFPKADYNTAQTVTVSAAQDDDALDSTATFKHTASGGGYGDVTGNLMATEQDDEYRVSLSLSPSSAQEDAGTAQVTVAARLDRAASTAVTVTVRIDGSSTADAEDYTLEPAVPLTMIVAQNAVSQTATVTLTLTDDDEIELDETLVLTSSGTGLTAAVDAVFTIRDNDQNAAVLEEVMAVMGRSLLGSASSVVGSRLSASPGEWQLPSLASLDPDDVGGSLEDWFQGSGFSLSLSPDDAVAERWALWGMGDYRDFEKDAGSVQYDGDLKAVYVGVDVRYGEDRMAGLAVSRSKGRADYEEKRSGRLETRLTGLHPYFRMLLETGTEVWAIGGFGWGDAEEWREGRESSEESDLEMWMASVGVRHPLEPREGMELALRGEASYMHLETDSGERSIDGLTSEAHQMRAGLEFSWPRELSGGILSEPFGALVGRYDGGDDMDGVGVDMEGGWRYADPAGRLQLEVRGQWLAVHSENGYDEFGLGAMMWFGPGEDGRGLQVRLSPNWGRLPEGESALWGEEKLPSDARGRGAPSLSLSAEAGYGAWSPRLNRVATWFGELEHGEGRNRLRLGTRLASYVPADALSIEVFGEWREDSLGSESLAGIEVSFGF